jgi:hypothetical protein
MKTLQMSRKPAMALLELSKISPKKLPAVEVLKGSQEKTCHVLLPWLAFPSCQHAGVTQLVECNLAKVDVASSSLVTRSPSFLQGVPRFLGLFLAQLQIKLQINCENLGRISGCFSASALSMRDVGPQSPSAFL